MALRRRAAVGGADAQYVHGGGGGHGGAEMRDLAKDTFQVFFGVLEEGTIVLRSNRDVGAGEEVGATSVGHGEVDRVFDGGVRGRGRAGGGGRGGSSRSRRSQWTGRGERGRGQSGRRGRLCTLSARGVAVWGERGRGDLGGLAVGPGGGRPRGVVKAAGVREGRGVGRGRGRIKLRVVLGRGHTRLGVVLGGGVLRKGGRGRGGVLEGG